MGFLSIVDARLICFSVHCVLCTEKQPLVWGFTAFFSEWSVQSCDGPQTIFSHQWKHIVLDKFKESATLSVVVANIGKNILNIELPNEVFTPIVLHHPARSSLHHKSIFYHISVWDLMAHQENSKSLPAYLWSQRHMESVQSNQTHTGLAKYVTEYKINEHRSHNKDLFVSEFAICA